MREVLLKLKYLFLQALSVYWFISISLGQVFSRFIQLVVLFCEFIYFGVRVLLGLATGSPLEPVPCPALVSPRCCVQLLLCDQPLPRPHVASAEL